MSLPNVAAATQVGGMKEAIAQCLARYADAFEQSKVDGYMCDFLDEELLELKLGVAEPEHRRIFLDWVEQMQRPGE